MGLKNSCAAYEAFAKFLHWSIKQRSPSNKDWEMHIAITTWMTLFCRTLQLRCLLISYEAIFGSLPGIKCTYCHRINSLAVTCLTYSGYQLDSVTFEIKIPEEKVQNLLRIIESTLGRKRIKLKEMQSLTGSLALCAKAMPSARAFIRRTYASIPGVARPHHHIWMSKGIREDLIMWKQFLSKFNGISYMLDSEWMSANTVKLQTDSAAGAALGCGLYFDGLWCHLSWPDQWSGSDILRDITFWSWSQLH